MYPVHSTKAYRVSESLPPTPFLTSAVNGGRIVSVIPWPL